MRPLTILALLFMGCPMLAAAQEPEPLPFLIEGGRDALTGMFSRDGPGTVDYYPISETRDIAVAYRVVGSSRALVDVYAFECSRALCSLITLKRWVPVASASSNPFSVQVDIRSGLSLRDHEGRLLLFASFDQ